MRWISYDLFTDPRTPPRRGDMLCGMRATYFVLAMRLPRRSGRRHLHPGAVRLKVLIANREHVDAELEILLARSAQRRGGSRYFTLQWSHNERHRHHGVQDHATYVQPR